jgi:molybdenum cofactor cytidylyltransferase
LGTAKQLVAFRGRSLLSHAAATALASHALRDEVAGARVVENRDWATGMGSSVRVGVAAVEAEIPGAGAVLFLLCDQPLVTSELLSRMVQAFREGSDLVAASYDGAIGVPALFARRFFGELRELEGDSGARRLLTRHATEIHAVPFEGGGLDVDTPADLIRLEAQGGS